MYRCVKRVFDFVSALLLLVVSSPLLFVLAVLVRLNLGSPVFFTQERTGKKMRRFKLIKAGRSLLQPCVILPGNFCRIIREPRDSDDSYALLLWMNYPN